MPKTNNITFNGESFINFTDHHVIIFNSHREVILEVPPSGIEARIAFVKKPGGLIGNIPSFTRQGGNLLFYKNHKVMQFQDMKRIIGNSWPIVSNLCGMKTKLFFGKAISPDSDMQVSDYYKGNKKIRGVQGFILY